MIFWTSSAMEAFVNELVPSAMRESQSPTRLVNVMLLRGLAASLKLTAAASLSVSDIGSPMVMRRVPSTWKQCAWMPSATRCFSLGRKVPRSACSDATSHVRWSCQSF